MKGFSYVNIRKIGKIVSILVVSLFLASNPVSSGFKISGAIFDDFVTPGQTAVHKANLINNNTQDALDLEVTVRGLEQSLGGGLIDLKSEEDTSPRSAVKFIDVEPTKVHLEPGQSKYLNITANVPLEIDGGTIYAIVHVQSQPQGSGIVGTALAMNIPVALTVADSELDMTGNITNITLFWPEVDLIFKNTGNTHFPVYPEAILKNGEGTILCTASGSRPNLAIVPSFSHLFKLNFEDINEVSPGTYILETLVKLDDDTVLDKKETSIQLTTEDLTVNSKEVANNLQR